MIQGACTHDGGITVWKAFGRLTLPEIHASMADFGSSGPTCRVLCDLTQATVADLTTTEIEDVITRIGRRIHGGNGAKAAIVAHGAVDYGLARMFSTFSEIAALPVMVKVFKNAEVAKQWLCSQETG